MRRAIRLPVGAALALVLSAAIAACGSGASTGTTNTNASAQQAPNIVVKSPAVSGERIQARYTCDGQDVSPPLEWGPVPAGVHELAVFLMGFRPVPGTKEYAGRVEWTLAGIDPSLHRLAAGQLPAGARQGLAWKHRTRYSLCPAKGETVHYQFEIYTVPAGVKTPAGFSGIALLRSLTAASGPTRALAHGGFVAMYSRR